jgi:hypothetical protein
MPEQSQRGKNENLREKAITKLFRDKRSEKGRFCETVEKLILVLGHYYQNRLKKKDFFA